MIKFTCLIVDDEMPARELLKEFVAKIPFEKGSIGLFLTIQEKTKQKT